MKLRVPLDVWAALWAMVGLIALTHPAPAQWQVPTGSIPLGKGQGKVGFGFITPGGGGTQCLLDTAPPTFGACGAGSLPSLNNGRIWVGNGSNAAIAVVMSGDCTIVAAGAITCTKTGGVAFGPFAAATGTGIPSQTGSTINFRAITGTTNEITATNGDGVSGNPTLSLPTAMTFTGKTVTGGTFATGAFNGTLGATTPSTAIFTISNVLDSVGAGGGVTATVRNTNSAGVAGSNVVNNVGLTNGIFIQSFGSAYGGNSFGVTRNSLARLTSTGMSAMAVGPFDAVPLVLGNTDTEFARIGTNGRVGIGTTTPSTLLSTFNTTAPAVSLDFSDTTNGAAQLLLKENGTSKGVVDYIGSTFPSIGNSVRIGSLVSAPLIFLTNQIERARFDTSGNLGIGTASPSAQLHTTSTVRFAGLSGVGTSGCLGNDTSGNITAGNPCTGTGFPSGGVKGDIAYYSAASTGAATKASDANIIIQGGDPFGVSTSTGAAALAYAYSKRVILPPAPGGATGVYKFSADVTFPTGTELHIPCGVTLKPDSGKVVRNIGVTKGGQCQIADTSAGGIVYLGRDVRPEWWPSTGGDSAIAINAADASTTDAVTNSADGNETIIRLACNKTYTPLTSIILHAKLGNDQRLVGCGPSTVFDPTGGAFSTGGMLTQTGATGGDSLMAFTWSDFTVTCSADQNLEALTLAGSGGGSNSIRSNTKNRIARLRITGCRTGIGFYNTRNVVVEDVQIQVRGDVTFDSRTMYFGGAAFVGDTDIVRGQYECSPGPTPTGGVGYGMRFDSTAGTNVSGIRVNGTVFYNCNKMVSATWSSTGTMGDHWFYGGTQCETCSNIADYGGSAAGINAAMIRFNDLYFTNSQDTQYTATISDGAGGSGNQMAISAVVSGLPDYNTKLRVGFSVRGAGVTAGTIVSALGTCTMVPLAPCTATVSNNHTILGGTAMVSNDSQPKFRFDGGNADEIVDVSINKVRIRGGGGCTACRIASFAGTSLINITDNQFASVNGSGSMPVEIFSFVNSRKATIIGNTIDPFGISGAPDHLVSASSSSNDIVITGNNVRGGASDISNFSGVTNSCVSLNLPNSNVSC